MTICNETKIVLSYREDSTDSHLLKTTHDYKFVDLAGAGQYPYRQVLERAFDFKTKEAAIQYNKRFGNVFVLLEIDKDSVIKHLKSLVEIYIKGRGPWFVWRWMSVIIGDDEREILRQVDCEAFPHNLNTDTDFFINKDCITYYSPTKGHFTVDVRTRKIV